MIITATAIERATVTVDGTPVVSGSGSDPKALGFGVSTFVVTATADGVSATYTVRIRREPQLVQQYLKGAPVRANAQFGTSVALAGDTLVVGAQYETEDTLSVGAVHVFVRDGGQWAQQAVLRASNAREGARFGCSVAISGDTIVVGSPDESGDASSTGETPNENAVQAGAAYVFVRNDGQWTQQGYLKAANADPGDYFGYAVAIDGDVVVAGAWLEAGDSNSTAETPNNNTRLAGAAYVFERNAATWRQTGYLKSPNANDVDDCGVAVAVRGATAVMGCINDRAPVAGTIPTIVSAGAAYVYVRAGDAWSLEAKLSPPHVESQLSFGHALAIDDDAIAVGAPGDNGDASSTVEAPNGNAPFSGAVHLFERQESAWSHTAMFKAPNAGRNDALGYSVALEGSTLIAGAANEEGDATSTLTEPNDALDYAGAAYLFLKLGGAWVQQAYVKAPNAGAYDFFASSVTLSGGTAVIGAIAEDGDADSTLAAPNDGANLAGAAYVLTL